MTSYRELDKKSLTPMMRQYMSVKYEYPEAIVFFRMGDFFEMFFEDAQICAEHLDITLTARSKAAGHPIPMAGVPQHAYHNYVNRMAEFGFTVVICDQVEDAKAAKGLVRREVTRVITPGMVLDPDSLDARTNLYLASVWIAKKHCGFACLDSTTGEFRTTTLSFPEVRIEIERLQPRELLLANTQKTHPQIQQLCTAFPDTKATWRDDMEFDAQTGARMLCKHFQVASLAGFGIDPVDERVRCAAALFRYLLETQKKDPLHLSKLTPYSVRDYMALDQDTLANLEILESFRERKRKGSLLGMMDTSVTAMGGRKLKHWLLYPLLDPQRIQRRQDVVQSFVEHEQIRQDLREKLKLVHDIERLNGKISAGIANPKDLVRLQHSLEAVPHILKLLAPLQQDAQILKSFTEIDTLAPVAQSIRQAIVEEAPAHLKEPGFIRTGYDSTLDEQRDLAENGMAGLEQILQQEREQTGIQSLKLRFHKNFGYSLSVTKANLHLVPEHYRRKQTLTNEERFTTEDLDDYQVKIMGAQERASEREQQLFLQLHEHINQFSAELTQLAERLAALDALSSFAETAVQFDFHKPTLYEESHLHVEEGRHPVVETMLPSGKFVPNTLELTSGERSFILLTGPNMSGKSTIMRQVALISTTRVQIMDIEEMTLSIGEAANELGV
ncbi:MAG: DNA mismatch repair protein MutS, partial [Myxococcota bacterium]